MTDTELKRLQAICEAANVDDIEDVSDGFHTFNDLYEQRMYLFAALVNAYKDRAWKSLRHEDGEMCFGGDWFIVGIDTPQGTYTYHYGTRYWDVFDCQVLKTAKHWDGHTEKDVTRLLSLPSAQPTEASCWGCNCPKMERLKEQKTFSEMVHLHDAETHDKRTETHACDLISRQAAIDAIVQYLGRINRDFDNWKCTARIILDHVPSAQPDLSSYSDKLWRSAYERGKRDAQPDIIRCKDCKHKPSGSGVNHDISFPDGVCPCQCEDYWYSWMPKDNWFCGSGERREDERSD